MASSSKPGCPKVMSSYHWGRHCGPYFVCVKQQPWYDHFKWLMKQHASSDIPEDCMWCAYHSEAKRHQSDPEHIPIQKKGDQGSEHVIACIFKTQSSLYENTKVPSDKNTKCFVKCRCTSVCQIVQNTPALYRHTGTHTPSLWWVWSKAIIQTDYTCSTVLMLQTCLITCMKKLDLMPDLHQQTYCANHATTCI